MSLRTLHRRVGEVAAWRRPRLVAKGVFDAEDLHAFSDSYSKPLDHENMRENELISQMQDQMEATLAELMRYLSERDSTRD